MDAKHEYQMAYRAMRKWWKLVDSHTETPHTENRMYRNICQSYDAFVLNQAIRSIRNRRNAEYAVEHPETKRRINPAKAS